VAELPFFSLSLISFPEFVSRIFPNNTPDSCSSSRNILIFFPFSHNSLSARRFYAACQFLVGNEIEPPLPSMLACSRFSFPFLSNYNNGPYPCPPPPPPTCCGPHPPVFHADPGRSLASSGCCAPYLRCRICPLSWY